MQSLIESRRLRECDMNLRVDHRAKITTKVVGTCPLRLPSVFRLDLKDCYFVTVASQNLIFISVLAQDNFDFNFNKDF